MVKGAEQCIILPELEAICPTFNQVLNTSHKSNIQWKGVRRSKNLTHK